MDRENRGLISNFKSIFWLVWVLFSTVTYGIVCIILSAFSRKMARSLGRIWNLHLLGFGGVKIEVRGIEKLDMNARYVFVANHQSALDIPVLIAGLKHQLSFIAKKELFMIPFFGWGIAAMGHIWIDRGNARKAHNSIDRAVRRLRNENISLMLFPEGTRSIDGKLGEFKQASFTLALRAGVQVVPVAIKNAASLLPKSTLFIRPGTVYLEICDPINIEGVEITKGELSKQVRETLKGIVEK
jgi:1-acyl-sn-glycerol-3-phosphate acyltransferase